VPAGCGGRDEPYELKADVVGTTSVAHEDEPVYVGSKRVGTVKGVTPAGAAGGARVVQVRMDVDKSAWPISAATQTTFTPDRVLLRPGPPGTPRLPSGGILPATQATVQR
jgi:hypothetical protein